MTDDDPPIMLIPLVGDEPASDGPRASRRKPRTAAGLIIAGLLGVGATTAIVTQASGPDGEGDATAASPATSTDLTTPPTLPPLETLPPTELSASRDDASAPDATSSQDRSLFEPSQITLPVFDEIDDADFPDVEPLHAVADLDTERARFAVLRVIDNDGPEPTVNETVIEITHATAVGLDRLQITTDGPGTDGGDGTLIFDRVEETLYTLLSESGKWQRTTPQQLDGSPVDLEELFDGFGAGLLRIEHIERAESLRVGTGGPIVLLPSGPAKQFTVTVDTAALSGSMVLQFQELDEIDGAGRYPDHITINLYVDAENRVVMTTNRLVVGDWTQVLVHTIADLGEPSDLTLPDPADVVAIAAPDGG